MEDDLFSTRADVARRQPLARRMRPRTLAEVVGQEHLTAPGMPLDSVARALADPEATAVPSSVVLWGPAGCGKTSIASVLSRSARGRFAQLSAITAGVKDVREVIATGRAGLEQRGERTVLFLDEIHRFSKAQQDALLPAVEDGWVVLVAATTENPHFALIRPLLSRSLVLPVRPLDAAAIGRLIDAAVSDERGLRGTVRVDPEARAALIALAGGDARRALTVTEAAAAGAAGASGDETATVTTEVVARIAEHTAPAYDRAGDQHYDVTSALIKSLRGSDVDAALHYLARMVEGGEDVAFIGRRLMIFAAEDIGLADPHALVQATSAYTACTNIGWPEARIIFSQAVIYCALAPKSNAAIRAIDAARADVRAGKGAEPPAAVRDAHYAGATGLGAGVGYRYPHDVPEHVVAQQYPPDDLVGVDYYDPGTLGREGDWRTRLARLRHVVRGT